jgi:hypothetical protein
MGTEGPVGPQGPVGPRGAQGDSGILIVAGKSCTPGTVVQGFDASGALICAAAADPFPRLALCGSSNRDVRDFVPAGTNLVVEPTCQFSPNVRAMLVTRGGHQQLDPAALQGFLANGGIVITEYSASIPVYNKAFNTAIPMPSARIGLCQDNVAPAVLLDPSDPFWFHNAYAPDGFEGCGFDLSAIPSIVPLGTVANHPNTVTLGYVRYQDAGRIWLVESDWSDGELTFSDRSLRMVQYMIKNR